MSDDRDDRQRRLQSALDEFQGPLARYAGRLIGDADHAADVVQETFLKLWSSHQPPGDGKLGQWLFTVCRNAAMDVRRKERRMSLIDQSSVAERPSPQDGPDGRAEKNESAGLAMRALGTLSDDQQEVVRLKFQNGFSYRQIAGITGHSIGNVGFLIHNAIKNLRHKLAADQAGGL